MYVIYIIHTNTIIMAKLGNSASDSTFYFIFDMEWKKMPTE